MLALKWDDFEIQRTLRPNDQNAYRASLFGAELVLWLLGAPAVPRFAPHPVLPPPRPTHTLTRQLLCVTTSKPVRSPRCV